MYLIMCLENSLLFSCEFAPKICLNLDAFPITYFSKMFKK